ncbi:glycosyltransferase [Fodinisporobacter ferrooxydans]|uniref:Glycosyltransferase n=1 Tax=Fodinisporobacter ferrooxydans TaxID=2901836 RepID=A0ABY4CKP0_9BACL|nr:glycosyltransferase [Alicyclobacillaceae bacterium MYW30-H2]
MSKNWKVLILYASYGEGHRQVSRVLEKHFHKKGIESVMVTDLFAEAHPWINAFTRYLYVKSYTFLPSLYGWSYYSTQNMHNDTLLSRLFHSFGIRKLREIIQREQPDVVINTFPMQVMPEFRKKAGCPIPTVTVLTDFALHNRWLHPEIDQFYVPTEEMKMQMIRKGIYTGQIQVSGIPLREGFECPDLHTTLQHYQEYGLDPSKKIVLVMASAYGRSMLKKIGHACLANGDLQMILLCGKNQSLQKELETEFSRHSMIRVFGYVDAIPQLMKMSSCLVTKAGGITLTEALAINLPIIIFRPVPGQEAENARYLTKKGAAITIQRADELPAVVTRLLDDANRLSEMRRAVQYIHKSNAAETIVDDIIDRMRQKVVQY